MSRALMELHWLPVDKKMGYKLLLYTYKALHGLAPGYLCKLVVPYEPRRVVRSAESNLITVPPGKPGKYGSRNCVRASANLWNSLREERTAWLKNSPTVDSFMIHLKRTSSVSGVWVRQCYLFLLMYIIVLGLFHCMLLYVYYIGLLKRFRV